MAQPARKEKLSAADREKLLREEHYVLRVQDTALASSLRKELQRAPADSHQPVELTITFDVAGEGREGTLVSNGQSFPVSLQDLPTAVELLKTKNDSDCVKGGEVGQILLVRPQGATLPSDELYAHGITPPMRNVRQEVFSALEPVDPAYLKQVSDQMLQICEGKAPEGWEFHDTEEEYKVDASGNGQWHILAPVEREEPPEPVIPQKSMKSPRGRGGGKKRRAAAA